MVWLETGTEKQINCHHQANWISHMYSEYDYNDADHHEVLLWSMGMSA